MTKKFFLVAFLLATATVKAEPNYCRYSFRFGESGVVCSQFEMNEEVVRNKIELTQKLYKELTGYKASADGARVFVISEAEINNETMVRLTGHADVVGRYFPHDSIVYITKQGLEQGNSDLAHELVHHMNAQAGIAGRRDEVLARKFEAMYGSRF